MAREKSAAQDAGKDGDQANEAANTIESTKPPVSTEVRMLVDHAVGKCNTVQCVTEEDAKSLIAAGVADDNPAAVDYAKSLAKPAKANDEPLE